MTTNQGIDALEQEFNDFTENLDSVAIVDAILAFCNLRAINAPNTLKMICMEVDLNDDERFVQELIEMSQSDYVGSLHSIRRAIEIADLMDSMEF